MANAAGTTNECRCRICGYEWESRVKDPAACPRCKHYDWRESAWITERATTPRTINKEGEHDEVMNESQSQSRPRKARKPDLQKKLGKLSKTCHKLGINVP